MNKLAKLDDSTLTTISGGRRHLRCMPPPYQMRVVDIAQTNVAVVFAPGNKGTIDIDQSNTAVVL
jgi:hypothetical protein